MALAGETPFLDFGGRWIVVTGASSGIGRAISIELARRGASLVLIGRNETGLKETARLAGEDVCRLLTMDLAQTATIHERLQDVAGRTGRWYGLCHAAGVTETRPLTAFRGETFRAMLEVNLTAGLELARSVTRRDVFAEDGGAILLIASVYGSVGMPGQAGYCATKGALLAAARALAMELARRRIRVNTLSPGLVRTPMTDAAFAGLDPRQVQEIESAYPLGVGQPEDVARAAAFLLAPQTRWITGIDLCIDGGYTAR